MAFRRPTVFVIGAGASQELGLPLGYELKDEIARDLTFRVDGNPGSSGHERLLDSIEFLDRTRQFERQTLYTAGRLIAAGVDLFESIDKYLETHKKDKAIEMVGKLAIARCILAAERATSLHRTFKKAADIRSAKIAASWLPSFARHLSAGNYPSDVNSVFANLTFIIFNYDRCVEAYLYEALQPMFHLTPDQAGAVLNKATFLHPYGVVGQLPWQVEEGGVPIGMDPSPEELVRIARQIKTYSESVTDDDAIALRIEHAYKEAETLVFLGFGFVDQNMELLSPAPATNSSKATRIIASAKRQSVDSIADITQAVLRSVGQAKKELVRIGDRTCVETFGEYPRAISG